MDALGIACNFTFVEGETRTNLKVIDPARHTNTDLQDVYKRQPQRGSPLPWKPAGGRA